MTSSIPSTASRLVSVPIGVEDAKEFVRRVHRHNAPPLRAMFATGVAVDGVLVGVALAERPKARELVDGWTVEITRVATDGSRNACSKLYAAMVNAARPLGWCDAITYTRESESGASLRGAAGWHIDAVLDARGGWDTPARRRDEPCWPDDGKYRWRNRMRSRPPWPVPTLAPLPGDELTLLDFGAAS